MIHKQKSQNYEIPTHRTLRESHLPWKIQFHNNPPNFRTFADLKVDNEIDNSSVGNKKTKILEKKLLCVLVNL